ncbi:uncharacterized protein [Triticum aestivum]|uniref:uncharacterized protein n=1 Tax=Triticum aestivum TaxID=4565 RepID=UPI001D02AF99|nr:uncharacterized protein LOC123131327 [Triticum aestivum]
MAAAFRRLLLRGLQASRGAAAPAPGGLSTRTYTGGSHVLQGHRPPVRLPHLGVADPPYLGQADEFVEAMKRSRSIDWKHFKGVVTGGMILIAAPWIVIWPFRADVFRTKDPSYESK